MISPFVRRLRLAHELRVLREDAGLTHEQLAKAIRESRAKISRLENGHIPPDQNDIIKLLDALSVDGDKWAQILTIAQEAAAKGWWESNIKTMGERQALYANLEAGAVTIREYQQTFLPGLLQIPDFVQFRTEADSAIQPLSITPEGVAKGRTGRQRMMRRPGGPTLEVLIDELAIRRLSAPPAVIRAQLRHLVTTATAEPRITVRVLPVEALIAGHTVPRCSFSLYTYADPEDPQVVAIDTVTSDLVLTEEEEVNPYIALYGRLQEASLPAADSLRLITETADRLPDQKSDQEQET
ncbi:helix-turn-helix domain-containing protein [Actinomadura scrupuli]|uniref:helix-turn-helix domain-containing protein n=1 Tax=Actinomadura scrupuli TaxID=559629 RepID=UPI003D988BF9